MATKAKWLTPAEESAWRKYIVASRRLLEALDDDLAVNGLSLSDYEILVHLSDAKDRMLRMSDLAEKTILSRSRLSHRIKYMEGKGWVERQKCASDKRGTWAVMTNKGWVEAKDLVKGDLLCIQTNEGLFGNIHDPELAFSFELLILNSGKTKINFLFMICHAKPGFC